MKGYLNERAETGEDLGPTGAKQQLKERGIKLPDPPEPFGTQAVTGSGRERSTYEFRIGVGEKHE